MFSPGFRLFFGISLAAFFAALIYGFFSGDKSAADSFGVIDRDAFQGIISLGWQGAVGDHVGYLVLVVLATVAAFWSFTLVAFRDADPESVAELTDSTEIPPAQAPTETNYWPAAGALGVGVFIVGLGTSKAIWIIGLAILSAVVIEWMLSAWADRATGDPVANARLRRQVMGPFELPIVSLLGVAVIAVALSRVFLTVSKFNAIWVGGAVAVVILALASLFVAKPGISKAVIGGLVAVSAVAIIAGGIVSAAVGQREFHHFEPHHGEDDGDHSEDDHSDEGEALGTAEANQ